MGHRLHYVVGRKEHMTPLPYEWGREQEVFYVGGQPTANYRLFERGGKGLRPADCLVRVFSGDHPSQKNPEPPTVTIYATDSDLARMVWAMANDGAAVDRHHKALIATALLSVEPTEEGTTFDASSLVQHPFVKPTFDKSAYRGSPQVRRLLEPFEEQDIVVQEYRQYLAIQLEKAYQRYLRDAEELHAQPETAVKQTRKRGSSPGGSSSSQ